MTLGRAAASAPLVFAAALALSGCASLVGGPVGNRAVPQPAKAVDLRRYAGLWYEQARYDSRFEHGCEAVTAAYRLRTDGLVDVVNRCRAPSGALKSIRGRARSVAGSGDAKLKVAFFGPFWGDYWVLDHADDYSWSIVGEPSGRFLWILTRSAHPDPAVSERLQSQVQAMGYDPKLILQTAQ
ncbi:MAG: lipocalin family protein [Caulobacteraceae bacterium]